MGWLAAISQPIKPLGFIHPGHTFVESLFLGLYELSTVIKSVHVYYIYAYNAHMHAHIAIDIAIIIIRFSGIAVLLQILSTQHNPTLHQALLYWHVWHHKQLSWTS